ncbi:hypothetical protein, partial [Neobacillus paridis]|uniref:hypothetical protein n=1 Tax=Neobacillus paridis TaxID=2803862 RepID=UPI001F331447
MNNEKCSWEALTGTNMENSQGKVFIGRFNVHEIGEQQMKSVHRKIQRAQKQGTTVKSLFMCKFTGKCFQPSPLIFLAKLPWIFYFISGKGCQMVF